MDVMQCHSLLKEVSGRGRVLYGRISRLNPPESVERTLDLAVLLPLDEISINVPYLLPGSLLFERVSGIEEGANWDKANEISFIFRSALMKNI
jgi:hypothetical protein